MKGSPCKDCEYRHLKCHADCDKYKEYAAERNGYNAERRKNSLIMEYIKNAHEKVRKGRR